MEIKLGPRRASARRANRRTTERKAELLPDGHVAAAQLRGSSKGLWLFLLFWFGRQGHSGGTSASLLKQTRAVIDANRVISLYLKGVADSGPIKVKSAALVTGVIYYC